jgi:alkanesulfonate monooxygenase SsuD/methylene tetrahydromethanopterin reductase-like flavin-dependent oxidoreductase (luciferase family)
MSERDPGALKPTKVGVALMLGEDEKTGTPSPWTDIRGLAVQAEELGFDSVWVYDHLLYRWPNDERTHGIWEGWSMLCGLAAATSRVELGTIVMCTAWRSPALLAKMAITADEISGGRIILGIGAGWHEPEFTAFGFPFDHLASRFDESVQIISPLLREGKVDFTGKYVSAPNSEMVPRGPRPGGPPVLIAARGERMLKITAQYADQWNAAWFGNPTQFKTRYADLVTACEAVGRDPQSIVITAGIQVAYPHLYPNGEKDDAFSDPERFMTGSAEEIAEGMLEFRALGVDHLITIVSPNTAEAFAEFGKALDIYRERTGTSAPA